MEYGKKTRDILADMAGVSHTTLRQAKTILDIGDEETMRRVRKGEISIFFAYSSLVQEAKISQKKPGKESALFDIQYAINSLLEELHAGDPDKAFVISMLNDVKNIVDKEVANGKETV